MLCNTDKWLNMCDEDLITAKWLLDGKRLLPMGFFCHLIVEKALKAVVTHSTGEIPPKTHNLTKLAHIGGIYDHLHESQKDFLEYLMPLQIDGRYTEYKENIAKTLSIEKCKRIYQETEGFLCWIKTKLGK
ncbi:MAG: HEPN domain-containing protein [Oscillospiraceae bacterium]|nr:HEPN domain-containing protein [Oscillospiraceae bacterium]